MPLSPENRRQWPRVPVDFETRFSFENKEYTARALNLSVDGMFLRTDYMLLKGDMVEVYFQIPEIKEPFWLKARVAWGTWVPEMPISGMGVQFIRPLPEQAVSIEHYLRTILNQ